MRCSGGWIMRVLVVLMLSATAVADTPVYTDALSAGWQSWSWGTTAGFANTSPVHGGAGQSISVRYDVAWAGFYLHTDAGLAASEYTKLRFSIHGGTTAGQPIRFVAYQGNAEGQSISVAAPIANTWTDVEIAVASLGVATINGLVWQEAGGQARPAFYLDDIVLVSGEPPPPGSGPALAVDAAADRHAISPHIYGMNFADESLAVELALPVHRWGGNATTRYNWQTDTSNHAMDWYFENIPESNANPGSLPNGSIVDRFVEADRARGTDSLITLPLIGWTPKARAYACGFSVAKYGPQQSVDPWRPDCGNGKHPDGTMITGNDPQDTSLAIGPAFVADWIAHLVSRYGNAAGSGVRFYNLDNEPMLWNDTHRDVHPTATSYDELRDRTFAYAAAIKTADPAAATLGPVLYGWTAYWYSAADAVGGGDWWNRRPDRMAHGDTPFVEWYLQQLHAYETAHGLRILDYLDLHYYPQAAGVTLSTAGDAATQARRLRSTRSLWDPAYVDESWIGEPVRLIPRMRDWVNASYPGTKLAITEYNWGGHEHINGALAQADVLGLFGREQLDLATLWDPPAPGEPAAWAFRMFRNYDGAGGRFGNTSVRVTSADQGQVSAYAGLRNDGAMTLMLINKTTGELTCPLSLTHYAMSATARMYRYSALDATHIVESDVAAAATMSVLLPASSINLVVFQPAGPPSDFDRDGDVDAADLGHFAECVSGPNVMQNLPTCLDADLDADHDVDQTDFARIQRCLSGADVAADPACD